MNTRTRHTVLRPNKEALAEHHFLISVTDPSLSYERQLHSVLQACQEAAEGCTVHFRRFFLSDAANQCALLQEALENLPAVPTSIVQQAPLDGTRIALWMYCTAPMSCSGGIPAHNGYAHHWTGSLTCPGTGSYAQMSGIFQKYGKTLEEKGLSLARDTVRTWIFVRDVDLNYAGIVSGRKDYFDTIGLTADTHYIASTGIEGRAPESDKLVEMDAYSVGGLHPGQLRFLHAPEHLNPTNEYGVTFERGTAVSYGDRRQVFISGTASIDAKGNVVHPGDAATQTRRMLENITALLSDADASLEDVAMAIVYLRDPADQACVREAITQTCPYLPALYVQAPVCRPAWLVEMECIALTADGDKSFPDF